MTDTYRCDAGGRHCLDFFRVMGSGCANPKFSMCCKCGATSELVRSKTSLSTELKSK